VISRTMERIFQQSFHTRLLDDQCVTSVCVPIPKGSMFEITHVSARVIVPRGQFPQCLVHASRVGPADEQEGVESVVLLQSQGLANSTDHLYAANHPVQLYVTEGLALSVIFSRSQPATGSAILEISLVGQRCEPAPLRASA
jgi:hypothetical protein